MPVTTPSNVDLAITLITHTTVTGVLYTFSLFLYCHCTRLLYNQLSEKFSRQTIFTFALASIIITCATIDVALKNEYGRIIYIDYGFVPGGPISFSAQAHAFTVQEINSVSNLIASFLAMGVLVSRHSFIPAICSPSCRYGASGSFTLERPVVSPYPSPF
jgi:hypothetical protein